MVDISLEQLGEHKTVEDLWVAVHGKVYNLTSFASDHPGGIDVLKDCAGTDGTETYDYAGHSAGNMKTMQKFLVGSLAGYVPDPATNVQAAPAPIVAKPKANTSFSGGANTQAAAARSRISSLMKFSRWMRLPILVAALGALAGLYKFYGGFNAVELLGESRGFIELEVRRIVNAASTFWGGLFTALSLSVAGMGYVYSQFSKTLSPERDVFSYPPVIPRPKRAGGR